MASHYNRVTGMVNVRAYDPNGGSFSGSAQVGTVSLTVASIFGGFNPGSSFTAPSAPVKLAAFTNATVTPLSGHRGFEARWYPHNKVYASSDGTASGVVRAAPSDLRPSGSWPYRSESSLLVVSESLSAGAPDRPPGLPLISVSRD